MLEQEILNKKCFIANVSDVHITRGEVGWLMSIAFDVQVFTFK